MIAISNSLQSNNIHHHDLLISLNTNKSDDDNEVDELPPEIDIQHYVQLISKFNEAVQLQDYSLINQCSDNLIQSLINDLPYSDTDPICDDVMDLLFPFFCSCMTCLQLNNESLFLKIVIILKNFSKLTTDVPSYLIENDILPQLIKFFLNPELNIQILTEGFKFFSNIAIYSADARDIFLEHGILPIFINIIQNETNYQLLNSTINFAHCFLRIDDYQKLISLEDFRVFLIHMSYLIGKFSNPSLIICSDEERTFSIEFILDIFNFFTSARLHPMFTDRTQTSTYLLNTPILVYLSTLLVNEIPSLTLLITRIILQVLIFSDQQNAKEKAHEFDITLFARFCFLDSQDVCQNCLSIIERLIYLHADNISVLNSIEFFQRLISFIDEADFDVQKRIIHVLIAAIILDQSYTLLPLLTFECVDIIIDYIDVVDEYTDYKPRILDALRIIQTFLPQNHPQSEEIFEALEELTM